MERLSGGAVRDETGYRTEIHTANKQAVAHGDYPSRSFRATRATEFSAYGPGQSESNSARQIAPSRGILLLCHQRVLCWGTARTVEITGHAAHDDCTLNNESA